jgi:hypothetical protein
MSKIEPKEIVVNRMFVGNYLTSNLGHEIINLFQADNGNHYLYLNAYGNFAKAHKDKIGTMLMVKSVGDNVVEVIGMAKEIEAVDGVDQPYIKYQKDQDNPIFKNQIELIDNEQITYGGVPLDEIFNDAEQQTIFVTFKAEAGKVFIPKDGKRIFILYGKDNEQSEEDTTKEERSPKDKYVVLEGYNYPSTSLKSYIYPEGEEKGTDKEKKHNDYEKVLTEIVNDTDLWTTKREWKVNIGKTEMKPNLFEICQIQNDENRLSNALAYFMMQPEYKNLWKDFFRTRPEDGFNLHDDYTVEREANANIANRSNCDSKSGGGRIDLLIKDKGNIVVIENKIKSGINSKSSDTEDMTQLDRYVNFVESLLNSEKESEFKPEPHYFIMAPDYNVPDLSLCKCKDKYHIIKYSQLFGFLTNSEYGEFVKQDDNFKAFRDTLYRHTLSTPNAYLFQEMLEKFQSRIKERKSSQR